MIRNRRTLQLVLALTSCMVITFAPLSIKAQGIGGAVEGTKHGVEKGAGAVGKGAEGAAKETKKGAESVGRGVKHAVTGDQERMKGSQGNTEETQGTETTGTQKKNLPKTAGELPLLAVVGVLCLAGAALTRRKRSSSNS